MIKLWHSEVVSVICYLYLRLDSSGAYDREAYDARRENRMAARKKAEEEAGCTDYKKVTCNVKFSDNFLKLANWHR
jgi:hypothetical protein